MALDTFQELVGKVKLRVPSASSLLARDWINNAFREIAERRKWSWLIAESAFQSSAIYNTGTVTVTRGSTSVTSSGAAFTASMETRQFRTSNNNPVYTILDVDTATDVLTLDRAWSGATASSLAYSIFDAYYTPASDFHSLVSVWDPNFNWQLYLDISQSWLNGVDSQRSYSGTAYAVANYDYDQTTSPPLPRYEIWPYPLAIYQWPYLYERRITDLDSGGVLPRYIRGDVLLTGALREAAAYPGTKDIPNPFANAYRLEYYDKKFEKQVHELELQDDNVYMTNLTYIQSLPFATTPFPFLDASFMQNHAF